MDPELLWGLIFGVIGAVAAYLEHRRHRDDSATLVSLSERVTALEWRMNATEGQIQDLENTPPAPPRVRRRAK